MFHASFSCIVFSVNFSSKEHAALQLGRYVNQRHYQGHIMFPCKYIYFCKLLVYKHNFWDDKVGIILCYAIRELWHFTCMYSVVGQHMNVVVTLKARNYKLQEPSVVYLQRKKNITSDHKFNSMKQNTLFNNSAKLHFMSVEPHLSYVYLFDDLFTQ